MPLQAIQSLVTPSGGAFFVVVVVIFFHLSLCHTKSMQQGDQESEQLTGDERESLAIS